VAVKLTDTIEIVKELIQDQGKIPINEQLLLFQGKKLKDEKTIVECGIQPENILRLVLPICIKTVDSNLDL
jgi:hypothetical protein